MQLETFLDPTNFPVGGMITHAVIKRSVTKQTDETKGVLCPVAEHGMVWYRLTTIQKNKASLSPYVQFKNGSGVVTCSSIEHSTTSYVLPV